LKNEIEKKKSYKRTQIEKTIKRMGIKIKIKNKLDGNYKLLTRGLNRKKITSIKKQKKIKRIRSKLKKIIYEKK
jgi:hypothetical protein